MEKSSHWKKKTDKTTDFYKTWTKFIKTPKLSNSQPIESNKIELNPTLTPSISLRLSLLTSSDHFFSYWKKSPFVSWFKLKQKKKM